MIQVSSEPPEDHVPCEALRQMQLDYVRVSTRLDSLERAQVEEQTARLRLTDQLSAMVSNLDNRIREMDKTWTAKLDGVTGRLGTIQTVLIGGLLSIAAGLAYIILNHALL